MLQRHLGQQSVRFTPADRALLVALLHPMPRRTLHGLGLLVRPDTQRHLLHALREFERFYNQHRPSPRVALVS